MFERYDRCAACGSKKNLGPHHIIPCHSHDKIFYDVDNGAILCAPCHDRYHGNYFPINRETFDEFCQNKKQTNFQRKKFALRKKKKKKNVKYSLKEYEPHPNYSKIRINDFTKKPEAAKKTKRKRKRRKRKSKRLNPIYLTGNLGTDYWQYHDKIELEMEVLGDY